MSSADERAKVVVLVGFLGAGKTTLLTHLLTAEQDMSGTVVIVNEFGEIGFDGSLIKRLDSDVIELVSGCVCCTLVVDLTVTLRRVLDQFSPRRILIEASGVADPNGIEAILASDGLRDRLVLHRTIAVLDARCWEIRTAFGQLFANQLDSATHLVLNKVDLIDRQRLASCLEEIRLAVPQASVIPAVRCRIDPDAVWADEPGRRLEPAALQAAYLAHDGHAHSKVHADDAGYVAFAFEHHRPLDEARFREFLGSLPFEVFRVKGTVRFRDRTEVINLVGGRGDREAWEGEQATRLAFVGWDVDGDEILGRLAACVAAG